jgi:hypothetical protein
MKKTKTKNSGKARSASKPFGPPKAVQEALQTTWLLKGQLKNARISYLRIGALLSHVRNDKLYAELKHPDIEDYAEKRLQLGRASLYRYLQVYDWVSKYYPEWLQPKPKGFIPELYDVADLMWIESELARKDLAPSKRAALEDLKNKALNGQLTNRETDKIRRSGAKTEDSLKTLVSKLRNLRTRGARLVDMPQEAITHIDTAIEIIKNANTLARFSFNLPGIVSEGLFV